MSRLRLCPCEMVYALWGGGNDNKYGGGRGKEEG